MSYFHSLSDFLWEEFKEKLILQLQAAVNMWNPYQDTKMIDSWLLPWLPILGKLKMIQVKYEINSFLKTTMYQLPPFNFIIELILQIFR